MEKCPICNQDAHNDGGLYKSYVNCCLCGELLISRDLIEDKFEFIEGKYNTDHLNKFLFFNKIPNKRYYIGSKKGFDSIKDANPHAVYLSIQEVENWYPKTIMDKINLILLKLSELSKYDGDFIQIEPIELQTLFFASSNSYDINTKNNEIRNQVEYIFNYLKDNGYVNGKIKQRDVSIGQMSPYFLQGELTPKALSLIYELQNNKTTNKNVFVSMSFHEKTEAIRTAIKKGIEDAGYSSLLMDEIIHNHQIVPEMLRLIKESKFLIMDITNPNLGAYFEAGYAQGLNKEIIITCSKTVFSNKDYKCDLDNNCFFKEIATKPHFDIAQKQILVWEDYEDLSKKLVEWIKSLNG